MVTKNPAGSLAGSRLKGGVKYFHQPKPIPDDPGTGSSGSPNCGGEANKIERYTDFPLIPH